jgi:hypothetical protein
VHAWSTIFTYRLEQARRGQGDLDWLERCFQKLLLNFTWWVNRKDRSGNNVFEGGFLGLDKIGVFDRSSPLTTGGYLEQAEGHRLDGIVLSEHARDLHAARAAPAGLCRDDAQVRRAFRVHRVVDDARRRRRRDVG